MRTKLLYSFFAIASLLLCSVEAKADNSDQAKFSMEDITIKAGETKLVEVEMTNPTTIAAATFRISLPTGFSLEEDPDEEELMVYAGRQGNKHTVDVSVKPDYVNFLMYSTKAGQCFKGNSGTLFTMLLKADASVADGTYTASISNLTFSDADDNLLKQDPFTVKITVGNAAPAIPTIKTFAYTDGTTNLTTTGEDDKFYLEDNGWVSCKVLPGSLFYMMSNDGDLSNAREISDSEIIDGKFSWKPLFNEGVAAPGYWAKHTANPVDGYATVAYDLKGASFITYCSSYVGKETFPMSTTIATKADGTKYVKATEITNGARMANGSGYLVKCKVNDIYFVASKDAPNVTTCLQGALTDTPLGSNLVFGRFTSGANKGKAGFGKDPDGTVSAHHAYMANPNPTSAQEVIFVVEDGEEATGITGVSANSNAKVYYNIAGQRVANPTSGLYIVNGKTILVK